MGLHVEGWTGHSNGYVHEKRRDLLWNDIRAEKAIGKKVYGGSNPTELLFRANEGDPDLFCETLAIVCKDGEKRPFSTYIESPWYNTGYKHYDIIIVKDDDVGTDAWDR